MLSNFSIEEFYATNFEMHDLLPMLTFVFVKTGLNELDRNEKAVVCVWAKQTNGCL